MWRDADTEACDLKSNALIARDVAINRLVVEGAESFALRALATALRVWLDCGGMPDGIDEIFTIRLPGASGQRGNEVELRRPSHKCYLRTARRRRQGRQPAGSSAARALTTSSTARR